VLLAALLAHTGCDVKKVAMPLTGHADWTRLTGASVQEPVYPDWRGGLIVYSGLVSGSIRNEVIHSDGSGGTSYPGVSSRNDLTPRWVADSVIVFASDRAGTYDLWYLRLSNSSVTRLTAFAGNEVAPAPRPGSPGLAYTEAGATTLDGRIVLIPDTAAVSLQRRYLTPDTLKTGEPDWDPSGNRVCFSAQGPDATRQIWLATIAASDTTLSKLTSGPFHDYSPRFSPDGTHIVFTSDRTGREGVWVVSAAGETAGLTLVTFDDAGQSLTTPAWSPDGHMIVVSSGGTVSASALWILSNIGF
jgi:Tol biopolymer transport system component